MIKQNEMKKHIETVRSSMIKNLDTHIYKAFFFFCASMQISCKLLVNKCRALLNTQVPNAGLQTKHFAYCKRSGIHNFLTVFQIVSVLQGRTVHLLKMVQVCCVLNKIRTKKNESVSFLVIANKPASLPDLHRYIYIYIYR